MYALMTYQERGTIFSVELSGAALLDWLDVFGCVRCLNVTIRFGKEHSVSFALAECYAPLIT